MPSVSCPGITQDAFLDCTKPLSAGVKDMLYLFNFSDLETITESETNPSLIEGFTLKTGAFIYQFEGRNNSIEPRSALVKGRYSVTFDHELIFKMFNVDTYMKEQLQFMCNTKVVAIVENNYKGQAGQLPFEIYGLRSGLEMTSLERVVNDNETQGAYNCTLATSEQIKEPYLPATLFTTNYATTKAIITSYFFD